MYDYDPDYEAYLEREAERGELAFTPHELPCYACTREAIRRGCSGLDVMDDNKCLRQEVVSLGRVVEAHRDPTQTYKLACGHITI